MLHIQTARAILVCAIIASSQDCKPPDGYAPIKENSKFLFKSEQASTGVPNPYPDGTKAFDYANTFNKICASVKLEPWLPRSRVDWEAYHEFMTVAIAKYERPYWWPIGVYYRKGFFYKFDNTSKIQDGEFEHSFNHWNGAYEDLVNGPDTENCVGMKPVNPVTRNYMYKIECVRDLGYPVFQLCQWPKDSDCYKNSLEEKKWTADLEANKFIQLASTHSGDIFLSKQHRSFAGGKTLCEENAMRMIQFSELRFKDGDVSQLVANYRHKLEAPYYPFYYWVDALGDGAPTKPPRGKRDAEGEWDSRCWGNMPQAYNREYPHDSPPDSFRQAWCHMPNNVVCIKDGLPLRK